MHSLLQVESSDFSRAAPAEGFPVLTSMQELKLDWNANAAGARLRIQREANSMRTTLWIAGAALWPLALAAQSARAPLIHQAIDAGKLARLAGNTRPEAATAADLGAVPGDLRMEHMLIQLRRSDAAQQSLESYLSRQQDPHSPDYHHWLTAAQFAQAYGAAQSDADAVSAWLRSQGFTVNFVYPGGMLIDFSGAAGQVAAALHTGIHYLNVNGERSHRQYERSGNSGRAGAGGFGRPLAT